MHKDFYRVTEKRMIFKCLEKAVLKKQTNNVKKHLKN